MGVCASKGHDTATTDVVVPLPSWTFAPDDSLPLPLATTLPEGAADVEALLSAINKGRTADLARAKAIAANIRTSSYTLRSFHDDLAAAFPELGFYMIDGSKVSSGGTPKDEYLRTMGAAFAFYWLMRIGIDGERGFCFGVDADWHPNLAPSASHAVPGGSFFTQSAEEKRFSFYSKAPWSLLLQLLVDAGCLRRKTSQPNSRAASARRLPSAVASVGSLVSPAKLIEKVAAKLASYPSDVKHDEYEVDIERTCAMLVLTAIHDIMKIESLLPAVAPEHAPYDGYLAGDTINDHDAALAYVLETCGSSVLPSFAAVPERQRKVIRFTQSKIGFNHGWLVQGEAPPAALFSKFKAVIQAEHVSSSDVAFYFVHWLTDLAGAEPTPLRGSEKFVLKFPHFVLDSFIQSFHVINELANRSETEVFEAYLIERWQVGGPDCRPTPS